MNLKEYLFSIGLGSLLCITICILVVMNFDPEINATLPLVFFYSSLFMGIFSGFSFFAILAKKIKYREDEIVFRQIKKVFRQALIFSCLVSGILYLAHMDLLNWLTFLLIIFFYLIFEGVIFSKGEMQQ
ncbi:MAG TPA: hypothetical protein P5230_00240 [Candidatus Magasanikbacteria bacterium]|nr:hypothetical protein [Candidatus Magasanikbacteria bacterium]